MIWMLANAGIHNPIPANTEVTMATSWYGQEFQGRTMANGEPFDRNKLTVAHRKLPLGTKVLLTNPDNGFKVIATVKDRGPYIKGRHLDASEKVAKTLQLKMGKKGTAPVVVQVLE